MMSNPLTRISSPSVMLVWVIVVLATGPLYLLSQSSAAPDDSSGPVYSATVLGKELQAKTKLPLRLPTFLPETDGQPVYAVIRQVTPTKYEVLLALGLPCDGENACAYGSVEGSSSPLERLEGKPVAVTLAPGIAGQFTPSQCHAYCNNAYIRWKENGVFYSIGVKAGKRFGLVRAVKSALQAR